MVATTDAGEWLMLPLPLTVQQGWVLLIALGVGLASLLVFLVLAEKREERRSVDDWSLNALNTFAIVLAPIWMMLLGMVLYGIWRISLGFETALRGDDLRWHVLAFVGLVTALGALVSAPLALIRVYTTERQTRTAEQGHMTDRISKAVEQLGQEKTVKEPGKDADGKDITVERTQPNIEVRIGGLYALERIAQDSMTYDKGRDHIRVMEIICAYVRENAPAKDAKQSPHEVLRRLTGDQGLSPEAAFRHADYKSANIYFWEPHELTSYNISVWVSHLPLPRTDVQTALTILGRRGTPQIELERAAPTFGSEVGYRLGLRDANLQSASLAYGRFQNALLIEARMQGANLWGTQMQGADLWGAELQGAYVRIAQFQGADLTGAQMQGAELWGTQFSASTTLTGTVFDGAAARAIDMSNIGIAPEQIRSMFGDASVILPGGVTAGHSEWPTHWPSEVLDDAQFEVQWQAFQRTIGYSPAKT
ncbi:pentapeptide repeat-containing protein [Fertoebacter nigrum]|uniref:Pentapeptide repeat-containing protein n=1 Tax=Fertoeibacter niger TaxID=2656921 RepID=A0A8X8KMF5_9RHOB|nr:pentapeptide repeat-containing protein [Fertoeibacter niger]NUB42915.1 pentapeptide repeat-containing protein [Fertoeibacter niger]